MTYELAKQLQDAGFPQNTDWYFMPDENHGLTYGIRSTMYPVNEMVAAPSLEELIEACGNGFGAFARNGQFHKHTPLNTHYVAWGHDRSTQSGGSTPTEAVARLWLALKAN